MAQHVGLTSPPLFSVAWSCRRCGHTGGVARTTAAFITPGTPEPIMRELFASLRRKLVKIHLRQGCVASVEDFVIARTQPTEKPIVGLV